jgi:hypothetical protein
MTDPTAPDLTPNEIVTHLSDAGLIDRAAASLLEQRIVAYGDGRAAQALETRSTPQPVPKLSARKTVTASEFICELESTKDGMSTGCFKRVSTSLV